MLSDDDVQQWLDPEELLAALAQGFTALSAGEVAAPPRNGQPCAWTTSRRGRVA